MKKYFSLASALMLALSMGMTSCSNDLDEVQAPAEQQPEMHKLYLSATAPNSTETRAYVEGVEGSDYAIKITGWKAGDKLYGIYMKDPEDMGGIIEGEVGMVEFKFNGSTKEFESDLVPTSVTNEEIKYFLHGNNPTVSGNLSEMDGRSSINATFLFSGFNMVDIENNSTDIPMWGKASVVGEKLAADMQLPPTLALVCVHNNSGSEIEVSIDMVIGGNTYPMKGLGLQVTSSLNFMTRNSGAAALTTTIPAGGKAYLPMRSGSYDYKVKVGGTVIGTKAGSTITAGKVYKLIYTGA